MIEILLEDLGEIVGSGNTAEVYQYSTGKVIKLFRPHIQMDLIEKEFSNSQMAMKYNFHWIAVYDMVKVGERIGIVYDEVKGISLLQWIFQKFDAVSCGELLAREHKKILQNSGEGLKFNLEYLYESIRQSEDLLNIEKREYLNVLKKLPVGNSLCHGDLHMGNVYKGTDDTCQVISYVNMCQGHPNMDIARTVYMIEMTTPGNSQLPMQQVMAGKKAITRSYLSMMGVTRNELTDWFLVVAAARLQETTDPLEKERILKYLRGEMPWV